MLTMERTFDQIVYEDTATEIIEDLAASLMESKPIDNTYSSVVGIDKAVSEVEFSESIRELYKVHHNRNPAPAVDVQSYLRSKMDIMKVGKFDLSVRQCAEMTIDILKNGGDKLYGILLSTTPAKSHTKTKMTFNPLHPVIATELSENSSAVNLDEEIWTLNVFAWKDDFNPEQHIPAGYNDTNYITEIANVIAAMSRKSPFVIKNTNIKAAISENKFVVNYEQKKYHVSNGKEVKDEHGGKRNWIVPMQILNNGGIAYPYYGSAYTRTGIAWNLTPMMSANISRPTEGNSGFENGGRICTKSGDSKTIKGVSALNHSNLTSPLNSNCFRRGSLTYAHQAMLASLEILTGKSLTNSPSVEKPDTLKEYLEKNPGKMAKDYLIYMREYVTGAHLEEKDDADIAEAALAEADVEAELDIFAGYPIWQPGVHYNVGDVVNDTTGFNGGPRLRIMGENNLWADYIPPIDLTEINTVLPGPAPAPVDPVDPLPWASGNEYRANDRATRRGWVYRVNRAAIGTIVEEPTQLATHWIRVRPMQPLPTIEEIA